MIEPFQAKAKTLNREKMDRASYEIDDKMRANILSADGGLKLIQHLLSEFEGELIAKFLRINQRVKLFDLMPKREAEEGETETARDEDERSLWGEPSIK